MVLSVSECVFVSSLQRVPSEITPAHAHASIYLPINGLPERNVQREARREARRKWIERECREETERQRRRGRREA